MKVVVLQSNYLPWKGYFDLINDADLFVYYDEVQYTKNDWRNRNRIYPKNGLQWITIPVPRSSVKGKISDAVLTDESWQEQHYRSLYYAYKKAKYFFQLEPLLHDVYQSRRWERLVDLNRHLTGTISRMFGITTRFADSKDYELTGDRVERLIGLLEQAGATEYISGPAGRDYLSGHQETFSKRNITLTFKDYRGYPDYEQLAVPFEHSVSIVDMIANVALADIPNHIWAWRNS